MQLADNQNIGQAHEVNITDIKLRRVILPLVDENLDGRISQEEIKSLKSLYAENLGIKSITGLEYAVNLERLSLEGNEITDFSPLYELDNLKKLRLYREYVEVNKDSIKEMISEFMKAERPKSSVESIRYREVLPILRLDEVEQIKDEVQTSEIKKYMEEAFLPDFVELKYSGSRFIQVIQGEELSMPEVSGMNHITLVITKDGEVYNQGQIDSNETGVYMLTYTGIDEVENKSEITIVINILKKIAPEVVSITHLEGEANEALQLNYMGNTYIKIIQYDNFEMPKVSVSGKQDAEIDINLLVKRDGVEVNYIDTSQVGIYELIYTIESTQEHGQDELIILVEVIEDHLKDKNSKYKNTSFRESVENIPYTYLKQDQLKKVLAKREDDFFTNSIVHELLEVITSYNIALEINLEPRKEEVSRELQGHWSIQDVQTANELGIMTDLFAPDFEIEEAVSAEEIFIGLDRVLLLHDQLEMKLSRSVVERYVTNKLEWVFHHVASVGSKLSERTLAMITENEQMNITREQLAQIIFEITNGKLQRTQTLCPFTDLEDSSYVEALNYCIEIGLLIGINEEKIAPMKVLTKAELVTVLVRLNQLLAQTPVSKG